jgi:hypothetical protein
LRTTGYLGEVLSVACSQVRLNMLPHGHPRKFSFPLQNTRDFSIQAATLRITASLSELPTAPVRKGYTQTPLNYGNLMGPPWNGYPGTFEHPQRRWPCQWWLQGHKDVIINVFSSRSTQVRGFGRQDIEEKNMNDFDWERLSDYKRKRKCERFRAIAIILGSTTTEESISFY